MDGAGARITDEGSTGTHRARPSSVRAWLVLLHRWLSIGAAIFWLVQAITGLLLSFHWEIEDALLSSVHRPTDLAAIERRLDALAPDGSRARVEWIWTTAGLPDRYVVTVQDDGGAPRLVRIDGAGDILHDAPAARPGFLGLMRDVHVTLASGAIGGWILGVSGLLLISNLVMGLVVAWPRRGWWRQALSPARKGPRTARLYSWHRAVGLWAVVPALLIAATGTAMLFEGGVSALFGIEEAALPPNPAKGRPVGFAAAVTAATRAIPGSHFVGMTLPTAQDASYQAWVRSPGELYRAYGGSLVVIDANSGAVRGAHPLPQADAAHRVVGAFYPLHTGEAGGLAGRLLVFAIGLWLATMTITGLWLWLRRRPKPRKS